MTFPYKKQQLRQQAVKPTQESSQRDLVKRVLDHPEFFPDTFKAWLPRWLFTNVNFKVASEQLPAVESPRLVSDAGNAQFDGAWVNFGGTNESAQYYKDSWSRVYLGGIVKSGAIGTSVFTLPIGYRPQEAKIYAVASNGAFGICTVNPDGTVVASAGSNVYFSLSGISFRAFS